MAQLAVPQSWLSVSRQPAPGCREVEGGGGLLCSASRAVTRVLVETSDGNQDWTTVGVHENVVEASWHALVDALSYGLARTAPAPAS